MTKANTFLLERKYISGYTNKDIAALLNCGRSTVSAYFSGFLMPNPDIIKILAQKVLLIPISRATEEFRLNFEQWGLNHPNYESRANSYVPKSNTKAEVASENHDSILMYDNNPPPILEDTPSTVDLDSHICEDLIEFLYGNISYKDFNTVKEMKSIEEVLNYLYRRVDCDMFVSLVKFIP